MKIEPEIDQTESFEPRFGSIEPGIEPQNEPVQGSIEPEIEPIEPTYPCTRKEAAQALGISNTMVSRYLKHLETVYQHFPSQTLMEKNRVTAFAVSEIQKMRNSPLPQ